MKKLVLIAACAFCVLTASAQSDSEGITWGIRGGLNVSNQHGNGENAGSKAGFNVGVVADIPIISQYFYIQPGLYYTMKGYRATDKDSGDWGYDKYTEKVNPYYIEIPILLSGRYNITDKVQVQVNAGPYFAIGIAGKYKTKDEWETYYNDNYWVDKWQCDYFGPYNDYYFGEGKYSGGLEGKRFECGLSFGAGFTFVKHYYIGFQYELGLTNAYSDNLIQYSRFDSIKNRNCMISLGYNF
ncbi:MAG: PorT family protein [Prevotella sp.]|nr:PorT family protein [Prevotella sp.]